MCQIGLQAAPWSEILFLYALGSCSRKFKLVLMEEIARKMTIWQGISKLRPVDPTIHCYHNHDIAILYDGVSPEATIAFNLMVQ